MTRLLDKYRKEILPELMNKNPGRNVMTFPQLKKIVISMGLAAASKTEKNALQDHANELALLSGQKPVFTKSKKAISNFKLREDQDIGLKVTLRRKRMWEFLDRFCNITVPRIRDFRGFPTRCDGRGSYSMGLEDQQAFPEINLDNVKRAQGMNITFVTSAKTDDECRELLQMLGFPFK